MIKSQKRHTVIYSILFQGIVKVVFRHAISDVSAWLEISVKI